MTTSLAQQLRGIATLDAERLTSHHGAPTGKSYLFPPAQAASLDLDAVYNIAISGFEELLELDDGFEEFEDDLFAESSKRTDRMLLPKEANQELDVKLEKCLRRLSQWLTLKAGAKCLEWLIRRFRVHDMNVDAVIDAFLPYHDSNQFPRILSILRLEKKSPYYTLLHPMQSAPQPVDRTLLLRYMSTSKDKSLTLLTRIMAFLPKAEEEGVVSRTMLNFWSATLVDFVERLRNEKGLGENVVKVLVEGFVQALACKRGGADFAPAIYAPALLFLRSIPLAPAPYSVIITSLSINHDVEITHKILTLLIALEYAPQSWDAELEDHWRKIFGKAELQSRIVEIVNSSWAQFGLQKAVRGLVDWLQKTPAQTSGVLLGIVAEPTLPMSITKEVVKRCVGQIEEEAQEDTAVRQHVMRLLSERHLELVTAAVKAAGKNALSFESQEISFSNLGTPLNSIPGTPDPDGDVTMGETGGLGSSPYVLAVSAALSLRVAGVRGILRDLEGADEADKASAKTILKMRLGDNDPEVIAAIYEQRAALYSVMDAQELIDAISPGIYDTGAKKDVVIKHVEFVLNLAANFPQEKRLKAWIFRRVLFPVLMFTKARRITAHAVWKTLLNSPSGLAAAYIEGIKPVFDEMASSEDGSNKRFIDRIAGILGRNIAQDGAAQANVLFLMEQSVSANELLRAHALLLLNKVLSNVNTGVAVYALAELQRFIPRWPGFADVPRGELTSTEIAERLYSKPTTPKTLAALQDQCLSSLTTLIPAQQASKWTMSTDVTEAQSLRLAVKGVYALVNSATLSRDMATQLLRGLFTSLGDRSLVFLADAWTDDKQPAEVRLAAAKHGLAYIEACAGPDGKSSTDFQMLLPAVIILLLDEARSLREVGIAFVKQAITSVDETIAEVFGINDIYGADTANVKLLAPKEKRQYLSALSEDATGLIEDSSFLATVHSRLLNPVSNESKKHANLRRTIVAFLASHIVGWKSTSSRLKLLQSLSSVTETTKLQNLLPLYQDFARAEETNTSFSAMLRQPAERIKAYLGRLAVLLDRSAARQIAKGNQTELYHTILTLLADVRSGKFSDVLDAMRELLLARIGGDFFTELTLDQQKELFMAVLDSVESLAEPSRQTCTGLLRRLPLATDGIAEILTVLTSTVSSEEGRGAKRLRKIDGTAGEVTTFPLSPLRIFLESRDLSKMPRDSELLSVGLECLGRVVNQHADSEDASADFIEQTILGIITDVISSIKNRSEIQTDNMNVETLIRIIRTSANPRTAQMALLFIGNLARLVPDAVLHNVMPIFTYMGSSDFQRDDAYSFSVVEKTIESTIPVIVESMHEKCNDRLSLHIEARPLLRIFADMASRLPRHRSLSFFSHLVSCLGSSDFLAPLALLLANSGKRVRPESDGFVLARALMLNVDAKTRLVAIVDILDEVERASLAGVEGTTSAFMAYGENWEEIIGSRAFIAVQLVHSVLDQTAASQSDQQAIKQIVAKIVAFSARDRAQYDSSVDIKQFQAALSASLDSALQRTAVNNFVEIAQSLLDLRQTTLSARALNLLVERIPLVRPEVRITISEEVVGILRSVNGILTEGDHAMKALAMRAIGTLIRTRVPTEDAAVSESIPSLMTICDAADDADIVVDGMNLLVDIVKRLGSRLLPRISAFLKLASRYLAVASTDSKLTHSCLDLINAVVITVPSFLSSSQISNALIATLTAVSSGVGKHFDGLVHNVVRKVSMANLLPVVSKLWERIREKSDQVLGRYFKLIQQTIGAASRADLPIVTKSMFTIFLEGFDHCNDPTHPNVTEDLLLPAFLDLVEKLNEATFRPLFSRLYDWAALKVEETGLNDVILERRRVSLYRIVKAMLARFKSIMTPYLSVLAPLTDEILAAFSRSRSTNSDVWTAVVSMLTTSWQVDEGAYWTEQRYSTIIPVLTSQIGAVARMRTENAKETQLLATSLGSFARALTDETLLKTFNTSVLLTTRSDDARERLIALAVLEKAWQEQSELVQFAPETVAEFISESLQDEDASVEAAARRVLKRIEERTGDLSAFLE